MVVYGVSNRFLIEKLLFRWIMEIMQTIPFILLVHQKLQESGYHLFYRYEKPELDQEDVEEHEEGEM